MYIGFNSSNVELQRRILFKISDVVKSELSEISSQPDFVFNQDDYYQLCYFGRDILSEIKKLEPVVEPVVEPVE
jgi:hypothetical protein